jgi:uncharacterized protein YbaR (Trm112 family)
MEQKYRTDWFILNLIACPNCNGTLRAQPAENELRNVFCDSCNFACRFETAFSSPTNSVLVLPSTQLEELITEKEMLPPLIIHFKWTDDDIAYEQVQFFPFIAYRFLKEEMSYVVSLATGNKEAVTVYQNMYELPSITMYEQPSEEELAQVVSAWENISTSQIQRAFRVGYGRAALIQDLAKEIRRKKGIVDDPDDLKNDDFDVDGL